MYACSFSRTQHLFSRFKMIVEVYGYCIFTLCAGLGYICDYPMVPRRRPLLFKDSSSQKQLQLMRTSIRERGEHARLCQGMRDTWESWGLEQLECSQEGAGRPGPEREGFLSLTQESVLYRRGCFHRGECHHQICVLKAPYFVLDRPGATPRRGPSGCWGFCQDKIQR